MNNYELLFHEKTTFDNALHALTYISEVLYEKGIVKDTYLNALLEREKIYPTGILLMAMPLRYHTVMPRIPIAPPFSLSGQPHRLLSIEQMIVQPLMFR